MSVDPFIIYRRKLSGCPKLSHDEIYDLGIRWRDHADTDAREQLILCVLPYALSVAGKYVRMGVDHSDLISMANMGVVRAVDRFDPDIGTLTTFVTIHIRQQIGMYMSTHRSAIRVPAYLTTNSAQRTTVKPSLTQAADLVLGGIISLDDPMSWDRGLVDLIPDDSPSPVEEAINRERDVQRLHLRQLVEQLPQHEQEVIRYRLRGDTLEKIGAMLGVSRERVRQIEQGATDRLKRRAARIPYRAGGDMVTRDNEGDPLTGDAFNFANEVEMSHDDQMIKALAQCEAEFERARIKYLNRRQAITMLQKKHNGASEESEDVMRIAKPRYVRRRVTGQQRVTEYLTAHGASTVKQIIVGTGLRGSRASAALISSRDFTKIDQDRWDLTANAGKPVVINSGSDGSKRTSKKKSTAKKLKVEVLNVN